MAKKVKRLTDVKVKKLTAPGWYPDGGGLYLQVSPTSTKSWVYRYSTDGKERRQGLGSYPLISLSDARDATHQCALLRKQGTDPIEHHREIKATNKAKEAKGILFEECCEAYIDAHKSSWKNRKHESQWRNTMKTYAYPTLEDIAAKDVDITLVMKVLEPIWYIKTETASRVRQRIEAILDWASARGYREKENPARWRGHLEKLLPKRAKVQKVKHHAAMNYQELPEFYQSLRKINTVTAKALAFTILTATRSGETRNANWAEIDKDLWSIPEERMKAERLHRVPLCDESRKILEEMESYRRKDGLIFPGLQGGRPISEASLMKLVKAKNSKPTIHGMRSSFRDWCAEQTNYPREVAEAALAHSLKDKTEEAYFRSDLFEKRRKLMDAWADYCLNEKSEAEVIPINKAVK